MWSFETALCTSGMPSYRRLYVFTQQLRSALAAANLLNIVTLLVRHLAILPWTRAYCVDSGCDRKTRHYIFLSFDVYWFI